MNSRSKLFLFALLFGAAVAAGFFLMRWYAMPKSMLTHEAGLAWLKVEYKLSDEQFQRIEALHENYYPRCMEMCHRIATANEQVNTLLQSASAMTPELEAALQAAEAVNTECRTATLKHLFAVAALMPTEQGQRYLRDTAPRVLSAHHSVDDVMAEPTEQTKS